MAGSVHNGNASRRTWRARCGHPVRVVNRDLERCIHRVDDLSVQVRSSVRLPAGRASHNDWRSESDLIDAGEVGYHVEQAAAAGRERRADCRAPVPPTSGALRKNFLHWQAREHLWRSRVGSRVGGRACATMGPVQVACDSCVAQGGITRRCERRASPLGQRRGLSGRPRKVALEQVARPRSNVPMQQTTCRPPTFLTHPHPPPPFPTQQCA